MLITKKMHEARVKAIREAAKDEAKDYYIFRKEKSWDDGCMQWCQTYVTDDLDDIRIYINGFKEIVDEFNSITDLDEFENGTSKKIRGFAPIYTAMTHEEETNRPLFYAGYIRKIEKDRK